MNYKVLGLLLGLVLAVGAFAQDSVTLQVSESDQYGAYLTDGEGLALYLFEDTSAEASSATGGTEETGGMETGGMETGGMETGGDMSSETGGIAMEGEVRAEAAPCTGDCLGAWPPFTTTGDASSVTAGEGVDAALIGTSTLEDGSTIVTYNGWPLYYFVQDSAAGDVNGQGIESFGGQWFLVTSDGTKVEASSE